MVTPRRQFWFLAQTTRAWEGPTRATVIDCRARCLTRREICRSRVAKAGGRPRPPVRCQ